VSAPIKTSEDQARLVELLAEIKRAAREYYDLTGRPLGVTGEVAEYEAARLLGLELASPRQEGYDATRKIGRRKQTLQIKGRYLPASASKTGQKVSRINISHPWDVLLLVLLDDHFEAVAIYEASREPIVAALVAPGSKARAERGQLTVSKVKSLGQLTWSRPDPTEA
jgi:hypothetical protein